MNCRRISTTSLWYSRIIRNIEISSVNENDDYNNKQSTQEESSSKEKAVIHRATSTWIVPSVWLPTTLSRWKFQSSRSIKTTSNFQSFPSGNRLYVLQITSNYSWLQAMKAYALAAVLSYPSTEKLKNSRCQTSHRKKQSPRLWEHADHR